MYYTYFIHYVQSFSCTKLTIFFKLLLLYCTQHRCNRYKIVKFRFSFKYSSVSQKFPIEIGNQVKLFIRSPYEHCEILFITFIYFVKDVHTYSHARTHTHTNCLFYLDM